MPKTPNEIATVIRKHAEYEAGSAFNLCARPKYIPEPGDTVDDLITALQREILWLEKMNERLLAVYDR